MCITWMSAFSIKYFSSFPGHAMDHKVSIGQIGSTTPRLIIFFILYLNRGKIFKKIAGNLDIKSSGMFE